MTISSLSNSYSNYTQSTSTADRATQLLSDMDTDKDGKVSEGEFSAFGQLMNAQGPMGPPPSQSASVSSSTTSSVSATQGATSSQSVFATVDANADGSLSLDELTSMVAQADTQAAGMQGSLQQPPNLKQNVDSTSSGGTTSSSSSTNATDTLSSLFSSADTNGDGSLSLDEFTSMLSKADKQAAGAHHPPPPPPNATASTSGSNDTSSNGGTSSSSSSSSSTTSSSSSTNATDTLSSLFSSADTNGDNVLNVEELSALIAQLQANLKTNT